MRKSAQRVYQFRTRVPLVGGSAPNPTGWETTRAFESVKNQFVQMRKPSFRTRASWVDEHVSLGRNVRLCHDCASKWRGWTKRVGYAMFGVGVGDCMSCDGQWKTVFRFCPEERSFKEKINGTPRRLGNHPAA